MERLKKKIAAFLCTMISLCMMLSMMNVVYAENGYQIEKDAILTAYDNGSTDGNGANTKFIVTIPAGTIFKDITDINGLTLKVKKYEQGTLLTNDGSKQVFNFTAHRDAIDKHMNWHTGTTDSTNDAQFWRIWFEDESGKEVDIQLPTSNHATIVVEYLDSNHALKGDLGTRRTCVMDMGDPAIAVTTGFIDTDDYALRTSELSADIDKTDTHYKKVTYYIDCDESGNSAWGNLIALCSMKLTAGFIQSLSIDTLADGSAPFDAEESDGVDQPGNDSSASNKIVRTFDSLAYTLRITSASRATTLKLDNYVAVMESTLDKDITEVRYDSTSLDNVFNGDEAWYIEYKDDQENNLYIENESGLFKCDSNGNITQEKVDINTIISDSQQNENQQAYRTNIASQRLVAYRLIKGSSDNDPAVPSEKTVTVQLNVLACQNEDTIKPGFKVYVKGNKDNFTSEMNNEGQYVVSQKSKGNSVTSDDVKVSAAGRYNIVIKRNKDASYAGYFDFETGKESSKEEGGTYGRMLDYGITLQLFNETNKKSEDGSTVDGATLGQKGLRGIELPVNNISFDLQLSGTVGNSTSTDDYSAILWDSAENKEGNTSSTGQWERNLYWKGSAATSFAKGGCSI